MYGGTGREPTLGSTGVAVLVSPIATAEALAEPQGQPMNVHQCYVITDGIRQMTGLAMSWWEWQSGGLLPRNKTN